MKITLDTKTGQLKVGKSTYEGVNSIKKQEIDSALRKFLINNTKLSEYENDCMWMSYRYCIGRHTIAAHMHASEIWKNCKGRLSKEKDLFNAFDINREIENQLSFMEPNFRFPITSLNRIYTPAIDIFCEFLKDYNIKSVEELLKYKDVDIILSDNERGYKIETTSWEEWLRPKIFKEIPIIDYMNSKKYNEDNCWQLFITWKKNPDSLKTMNLEYFARHYINNYFEEITKNMPNSNTYFRLHDIEDLFVWNDLVHCFDHEHHHKSILKDGTECIWFWSWTKNTEIGEDGYNHYTFGYHKIRIPLDKWNGSGVTTYIPDESIKETLY